MLGKRALVIRLHSSQSLSLSWRTDGVLERADLDVERFLVDLCLLGRLNPFFALSGVFLFSGVLFIFNFPLKISEGAPSCLS